MNGISDYWSGGFVRILSTDRLIISIRKKELKKQEFPKSWNHYDDDIIDGRPVNQVVLKIISFGYFL